jgi:hypothetical protein
LELLKDVAFRALVLVCRHGCSLRVKRSQLLSLAALGVVLKSSFELLCPVHHEGTKATKDSSAEKDTSNAVLEEFNVEIDEKTNGIVGQP